MDSRVTVDDEMQCSSSNDRSIVQCTVHNERVVFDCSSQIARSKVYCLVGSIEINSEDVDNAEAVHCLGESQRISMVLCDECGYFKFGRWLSPKEKRARLWISKKLSTWEHTSGTLCREKNPLFYKLLQLKWKRAFEMVATISDEGSLKFGLYLKDIAVINEGCIHHVNSADIRSIVAMFFPNLVSNYVLSEKPEIEEKEDVNGFFDSLRQETVKNWEINTENIVPVLRPYQKDAIRFMISREDPNQQIGMNVKDAFVILPTTPPVLYSPITGSVARQLHQPTFTHCSPGGILADEMGLGKTVEIIGLILSHQRGKGLPRITGNVAEQADVVKLIVSELISEVVAAIDGYSALQEKVGSRRIPMFWYDDMESTSRKRCKKGEGAVEMLTVTCTTCFTICSQERVYWDRFRSQDIPFSCPECIKAEGKVYSIKGTLIIAPATICHQWYEELRRHIRDDIKINMYRGLVNDGYKHPEYLATQDIVICSFETLRSEIHFVNARRTLDSLRPSKRHHIAPTPLLAVEWWRICIDEAQMVEGTSSLVAHMCEGLKAVNRWCVTGTPITNSLQDLYGLVRFLGVEPFWNECWWRNALMEPYRNDDVKPLVDLFSKIMWRNTKKTVADQMLSPSMDSDLTVLRFTPIEEQFYKYTLNACSKRAQKFYPPDGWEAPIGSLHDKLFEKLMEPLQSVRKFIVYPSLRCQESKNISTEENLQEELFRNATQQIEFHQRNILMYYSGLAGLELLFDDYYRAAECYTGAIRAMKELDEVNVNLGLEGSKGAYRQLKSDTLQQIHIFSSILDIIKKGHPMRCITEKEAEDQLNSALKAYTEQTVSNLTQSYIAVKEASPKYQSILSKVNSSIGWLCEAINIVTSTGVQHLFIDAVRTALENNSIQDVPASNLMGLNLYVLKRWDELIQCAQKVLSETEQIATNNILEKKWVSILEEIIACHFSPEDGKLLKNCTLCICNKQISQLESLLFIKGSKTGKAEDVDNEKGTAGEQKISSLEMILRTFLGTFIRLRKQGRCDLIELGKETIAQLEEFKALLALAKQLYAAANEYVAKIDEVRQCKIRLQYATEEEITKYGLHLPVNLIIRGTERNKLLRDTHALRNDKLKQTRCLAKLRYLSILRTQRTYDCPICLTTIKNAWILYPCAHCVCVACFNRLKRYRECDARLTCVVCRERAHLTRISYVQNKTSEMSIHLLDDPNVRLKTSISVKVDALVRRIKSIRLRDPTSKTLMFTSFATLIKPLCRVLSENDIIFRDFLGVNRQKILADFRLKPEIEVLIMPMSSGAHGLNLTVANNIIFVEPQMDVSQIAQAIGRIDRIGQKREMKVHHFVVFGSVEEKIYYKYCQNQDEEWTLESIALLLGFDKEDVCT